MIEYISGKLVSKTPSEIIVDLNGMGYIINCSVNCYDKLPKLDSKILILIYFHIHENNQELYGFVDETERHLFKLLIGISGIGPKTAINMLSAVPPNEFKNRLIAGEVKMLTSLPGIGPKTARRIIIELKDEFGDFNKDDMPLENNIPANDAFSALKNLGFDAQSITKTINSITKENNLIDTEEIIKKALKLLK
tara:strand:+ start:60 stop:641 length:582 start_codon:yes stop_codon:yes gene_type:complete